MEEEDAHSAGGTPRKRTRVTNYDQSDEYWDAVVAEATGRSTAASSHLAEAFYSNGASGEVDGAAADAVGAPPTTTAAVEDDEGQDPKRVRMDGHTDFTSFVGANGSGQGEQGTPAENLLPPVPAVGPQTELLPSTTTNGYSAGDFDVDDSEGASPVNVAAPHGLLNSEEESLAHVAQNSRLPPFELSKAEKLRFPRAAGDVALARGHVKARNVVLGLWYADCYAELTLESAVAEATKKGFEAGTVSEIFDFLNRCGYINFGVFAPAKTPVPPTRLGKKVVVVGAGVSGLAAARHLEHLGFDTVVLEGRDRVGGRVSTFRWAEYRADLGAMVITGLGAGNPLHCLCRQTNMKLYQLRASRLSCPIYDETGKQVEEGVDSQIETEFNRLLHATKVIAKARKESPDLQDHKLSLGTAFDLAIHVMETKSAAQAAEHAATLAANIQALTENSIELQTCRQTLIALRANVAAIRSLDLSSLDLQAPNLNEVIFAAARNAIAGIPQTGAPSSVNATASSAAQETPATQPPPLDGLSQDNDVPGTEGTVPPGSENPAVQPVAKPEPVVQQNNNEPAREAARMAALSLAQQQVTAAAANAELASQKHTRLLSERRQLAAAGPVKLWTQKAKRLLDWHVANLEFANATTIDTLSLEHWDQDDVNEFVGPHLTSPVSSIEHDEDGARVRYTNNAGEECVEECDAVVVTLPLGVLKTDTVTFTPELPERKKSSIERMGFGLLNKVIVCFEKPFWDRHVDMWGYSPSPEEGDKGQLYMFWNFLSCTGQPVLLALNTGKAAQMAEVESDDAIITKTVSVLKKIFGTSAVGPVVRSTVTRWRADPFARGSYSYISVTATGQDYDTLSEPVSAVDGSTPRVFFGGEHTNRDYPATVHGAYLSGLREATRISNLFDPPTQPQQEEEGPDEMALDTVVTSEAPPIAPLPDVVTNASAFAEPMSLDPLLGNFEAS